MRLSHLRSAPTRVLFSGHVLVMVASLITVGSGLLNQGYPAASFRILPFSHPPSPASPLVPFDMFCVLTLIPRNVLSSPSSEKELPTTTFPSPGKVP